MNPIRDWNQFFFGRVSARPLAVFRIVFGVIMVGYLSLMSVEFRFWYTGNGLLQGKEALEAAGPMRFSLLQYYNNGVLPYFVYGLAIFSAICLTVGWRTRIVSVLLYLSMITLYHRNVSSNGGPDAMPLLVSFYMMFCPSGLEFSMDAARAARKRGTLASPIIAPWGMRLLQFQICLIYFQSCVIKCQGPAWMEGSVVHYILFNREFGQFNMQWLAQYPLLINVMTHGALMIEFALAFWLWFRPTRKYAALGGVMLHGGIRPILLVPGFGEIMVASYLTFFAHDEITAMLRFADPRLWAAKLGVRLAIPNFSHAAERPATLANVQQREFAFDGAEGRGGAESMAVS
jgi:Vitamin K-dependent gamma-carboxylase